MPTHKHWKIIIPDPLIKFYNCISFFYTHKYDIAGLMPIYPLPLPFALFHVIDSI